MCFLVVDINNVYLYVFEKDRDYCLYVDRNIDVISVCLWF